MTKIIHIIVVEADSGLWIARVSAGNFFIWISSSTFSTVSYSLELVVEAAADIESPLFKFEDTNGMLLVETCCWFISGSKVLPVPDRRVSFPVSTDTGKGLLLESVRWCSLVLFFLSWKRPPTSFFLFSIKKKDSKGYTFSYT